VKKTKTVVVRDLERMNAIARIWGIPVATQKKLGAKK
jgi:predicted metallopeptidase